MQIALRTNEIDNVVLKDMILLKIFFKLFDAAKK